MFIIIAMADGKSVSYGAAMQRYNAMNVYCMTMLKFIGF